MAAVSTTANNTNKEFIIKKFENFNIINHITIIRTDSLFDNFNEPDTYANMLDTSSLTQKALDIINASKSKVLFAHELYNWGDCDEMGPTEHFWTLYLVVEKEDGTKEKLKFYREVFERHDEDENVPYEQYGIHSNELCIFDSAEPQNEEHQTSWEPQEMHQEEQFDASQYEEPQNEEYDEYRDVIHNIQPSELSKQGQITLEQVRGTIFDHEKIFFIGEEETFGETDDDGPFEYFWNLYIFISCRDGSVIKRHFFREFDWRHDADVGKDGIPYDETKFDEASVKNKVFHL